MDSYKKGDREYIGLERGDRDGLPTIGTNKLGVSVYEKCASSNLIKFFTPENPVFSRGDWSELQLRQQPVETIDDEKIIIIVTRNEYDRWCAGVTQDLDDYYIQNFGYDMKDESIANVMDMITAAYEDGDKFQDMFMSGHSHPGHKLWFKDIIQHTRKRSNTFFIDMDTLNNREFWEWVCKYDTSWPHVNNWWDDWKHDDYQMYPHNHPHKPITEWVRYLLYNDKKLKHIYSMIKANQKILDDVKTTMFWWHKNFKPSHERETYESDIKE
tara:strand:- start:269 stop:1078 length:810 start_codon:yes stop_codon:yes gene_type:complete